MESTGPEFMVWRLILMEVDLEVEDNVERLRVK